VKTRPNIVGGLTERIPELEIAQEPREGHVTASEEADKGTAPSEQKDGSARRSWWRVFLGLK